MIIYLIRHGESEWNRESIFQGSSDPPLSQRGLKEAKAAAEAFKEIPLKAIYSSKLTRAYETAKAFAHYHPLTIQREEGLNERMMGEWEGLKRESVIKRYEEAFRCWQRNREEASIPGGEPYSSFAKRVFTTFSFILKKERDGSILILTHEGCIKALLSTIFQLPIDGVKFFRQVNTAVNILERREGEYFLHLFNGQSHLYPYPTIS